MNPLWCNGHWLEARACPLSPTDRGMTLGLGLFETILALDGNPVFAERHLARLLDGCQRLGWQPPRPELQHLMEELLIRNQLTTGRAKIRLAISGGSGSLCDLTQGADQLVWMSATAAAEPTLTTTAHLSPWARNERSPLTGMKCASYAENLMALAHAARCGFAECIFLNTLGHLCEAATANLFLVKNGRLLTPSLACGCLPGITRSVVIELAAYQGIPCDEASLTLHDLLAADEWFLTSSLRGLTGGARFEQQDYPLGPLTQAIHTAWAAETRRKIRP